MARITKGIRSKPRRKAWKPFWRRFRVLEGPVEFPKGFEHFEQGREMGFLTLSRFRMVLELIIFCTNLSWQYGSCHGSQRQARRGRLRHLRRTWIVASNTYLVSKECLAPRALSASAVRFPDGSPCSWRPGGLCCASVSEQLLTSTNGLYGM